jgi:fructose-bisphosphate aldolase, class I
MTKTHSLEPILKNGHGILLAYDHGFEHGPVEFDERSADPQFIMDLADSGYFTGVICQKGVAARYYAKEKHKVPLILKMNGKTAYQKELGLDPLSLQNCTVDEAIELGAAGIGYTIFVGSEHEEQMFQEFSKIEKEAHDRGLIVMAWMYPRGKTIKSDTDPETLEYAARLGLELNADAVKIKYSGDLESYKRIIEVAGATKVFVVGGEKMDNIEGLLKSTQEIKEAGALGLAVGRNIWQAEKPLEVAKKLADILY